MASQKLDLIIGAAAASIAQLEKDLSNLGVVRLNNIEISPQALTKIQDQIQTALNSRTYSINFTPTPSGNPNNNPNNTGPIKAGTQEYYTWLKKIEDQLRAVNQAREKYAAAANSSDPAIRNQITELDKLSQSLEANRDLLQNNSLEAKKAAEITNRAAGILAEANERITSSHAGSVGVNQNRLMDQANTLNTRNYELELSKAGVDQASINAFIQKVQAAQREFAQLSGTAGNFAETNSEQAQHLADVYAEINRELQALKAMGQLRDPVTESGLNKLESYRQKLADLSQYEAVLSRGVGYGVITQGEADTRMNDLRTAVSNLNNFDASTGTRAELNDLIAQIDLAAQSIMNVNRMIIAPKMELSTEAKIESLRGKIIALREQYPHMQENASEAYNTLLGYERELNDPQTLTEGRLKEIDNGIKSTTNSLHSAAGAAQTFGDKVKHFVTTRLSFMAVSYAVMALRKAFRDVYTDVSAVDKAMTELRKVTDLTAASYDSFLKRASSGAKEIGASVSELVDATADFARLGYSMEDSEMLAKTATIYKNVGDGIEDIGTASESVISTMKAFNIEAKDSMDIVDAFNEVGNNFAISSTGIGEALVRSASAMAAANNTMSETIALTVAGNDVVQDPQKVGTALKTLSMRIRGAKTELEDAGESTEGMASSVSKLREEVLLLTKNKVDIMVDDENFKSTYEILREMSGVWQDIADVDQANLLELLGGKRNSNVLTSILNNFKDAEAVMKTIEGDEGSAMKEQEKWLDSIEGKTQQLKATSQGLALKLLDSDTAKNAITALTKIVDAVSWLADHKGVIGGIFGVFVGGGIVKNITSVATGLLNIGSGIGRMIGSGASSIAALFHGWGAATSASTNAIMAQSLALETNSVAVNQNSAAKKLSTATTQGMASAASGLSLALGLVTAAISVGVIAWSLYSQHAQKEIQHSQELSDKYRESSDKLKDYYEDIKAAKEELDNAETDDKRKEAESKLLEIQTQITEQYKNQKGNIDLINESLDTTKSKLEAIDKTNASRYLKETRKDDDTINKTLNSGDFGSYFYTSSWTETPFSSSLTGKDFAKYKDDFNRIFAGVGTYVDAMTGIVLNDNVDNYELVDALEAFYDVVQKNEPDSEMLEHISEAISHYNEEISKVQDANEMHSLSFLEVDPKAQKDIGGYSLKDRYDAFLKAQEEYAAAVENGDNSKISEAYKKMLSIQVWFESHKDEIRQEDYQVAAYLGNMFRDAVNEAYNVTADAKISIKLDSKNAEALRNDIMHFAVENEGEFSIARFNKALANETDELHERAVKVRDALNYMGIGLEEFSNSDFANPIREWADDIDGVSQDLKNEVGETLLRIKMFGDNSSETSQRVKDLATKIKTAVSSNKLLSAAFKDLKGTDVLEWFAELCGWVDKYNSKMDVAAEKKVNPIADQIDNILDAEAAFDKLQKIYHDVKDGGQFDFGALRSKDFVEGFKDVEGAYNEFLETVAKYPNDLGKCQEAFNKLTTEYINQKGILDDLTDANKEVTIAYLKNIGVTNAEEVVNSRLRQSVSLTESQYKSLCGVLDETVKASKNSVGQYTVESVALQKLGFSAQDAARIMAAAQAGITASSKEGLLKRLDMYEKEAAALEGLYSAHQMNIGVMGMTNDEIRNSSIGQGAVVNGRSGKNLTDADIAILRAGYKELEGSYSGNGYTLADAQKWHNYQLELQKLRAQVEDTNVNYIPPNPNKSSSGGSSKDTYIDNWKKLVAEKKSLLERDIITEKEYYEWLGKAYKDKSQYGPAAPGLSAKQQQDYRDEVASIQSELYKWEKDQIQKSIDEQDAILKNKHANGLISEAEYQKQLAKVTEEGYAELKRKVDEEDLFGVDTTERLNAETELLEKIKSAHNAAYDAEMSELEHLRAMNLITDEQYYAKHMALVQKYYAGEKMYAEELKKAEEELYKKRIDLVKKYSSAAKEAISSIMNIGKSLADAVGGLIENIIDTNSSNFDLQKKLLQHQLEMNYITEKEYYERLEKLYKTYYKSKAVYTDEFWENQEELHQYETQLMTDDASAVENIHAKVVDMIKGELEEAKKAIDDTKDKYNELIDLRRKALEDEKEENDTEKSRAEKLNEIAELTRQLNALRNDNSAQGQRKYKEVLSKLIKARKDLEDFEEEQAYKAAIKQLENEQDAMEKRADAESKALEDKGNDNEWLVSEAWARMTGMPEALYNQLIEWQHKTSTSIKDDIIEPFEQAREAIQGSTEDVKELYSTISDKLLHPEDYYLGHSLDDIYEERDEQGNLIRSLTYRELRDEEKAWDSENTKRKELENWRKVIGSFAEDMSDIIGDSAQSVAKIINELFPSPITDLLVDGADMFADGLGMVGITDSMLETVALLGGTAGILEMMRGFQDLASGKDGSGIAIGGESIDTIEELIRSIDTYQKVMIGSQTLSSITGSILDAIGNGPGNGSSIVSAILALGASAGGLLQIGTLLAGGGGAGLAALLSAIGGLGGMFNIGSKVDFENGGRLTQLISWLVKVCERTGDILNQNEANGREVSGLRTLLYNGWVKVYEIVNKLVTGMSSSNMMSGFTGGLSALSGAFKSLIADNNGFSLLSGEGLGSNLLKVLSDPSGLIGGALSKSIDLIKTTIPDVAYGGDKTVNTYCDFNITGADASNIADEIMKVVPKIADYTINAMLDSAGNKGVKRSASSLY